MSSTQGDDHGFQINTGPGESDAEVSLYRDPGGSQQSELPERNGAEVSQQGLTEGTGGGYTPGDCVSFASKLTSLLQGIIEQTRTTMEGFVNNINEIDASSAEVVEELQNSREYGVDRKCKLEEDRDKVHQAACRVLEVLNITGDMINMARPRHASEQEDSH